MLEIHHSPYRRFIGSGRRGWLVVFVVLVLAAIAGVALIVGYQWALRPVAAGDTGVVRFTVESGQGSAQIAAKLKEVGLIRSQTAFRLYTSLTDTKQKLQAGGYALKRSMSVSEIVEHMSSGKTDEIAVTILPGLSLTRLSDPARQGSLAAQGFSQDELDQAFAAVYDHPLLRDKPAEVGLDGYIYPETYQVMADSDATSLVRRSFDEFYQVLQQQRIVERLAERQLTLHQGLTLASIIQQEVSDSQVQKQVAQVFLKRLAEGMPLGSDPTFIYAAERDDQTPTINYDSPYNTRRYGGLPPGPIGTFNLSALLAVIEPADGDYLYFAAGDDGVTRFARTLEEHEQNVAQYGQGERSRFSY